MDINERLTTHSKLDDNSVQWKIDHIRMAANALDKGEIIEETILLECYATAQSLLVGGDLAGRDKEILIAANRLEAAFNNRPYIENPD